MKESSEISDFLIGRTNARVNVRRWAPASIEGRVICLHALGSNGGEFRYLAEHLCNSGYEVICADWIGHGESEYFFDPKFYHWQMYVQMTWALSRKYGGPTVHYIGNSWGGFILFMAFLSSAMRARTATFLDIPLVSDPAMARHVRRLRETSKKRFANVDEAERYLSARQPSLANPPPELAEYFRRTRFRSDGDCIRFSFDPAVAESSGPNPKFDLTRYLRRISVPSLFLYGRNSSFRQPDLFRELFKGRDMITYIDDVHGDHPLSLLDREHIAPIESFLRANSPAEQLESAASLN